MTAGPIPRVANDGGRMRVLLVHDRFPGQFVHLARALAADPAVELRFLASRVDGEAAGVAPELYRPSRPVHANTHPYLRPLERAVLNGQAAYRRLLRLQAEGYAPDLIYFHSGFGPGLFLRDLFPRTRLAGYFEWYFRSLDGDAAFLNGGSVDDDTRCRLRLRNADILLELLACDVAITPTSFQRAQFPAELQTRLAVLHDGVDTEFFSPGPVLSPRLAALGLERPGPIVTYATRGMEPYRGFPQFMQAAALLLERHPGLRVVIAGSDEVAYSAAAPVGKGSYLQQALAALPGLDRSRLVLAGRLDLDDYRDLLRRSTVHVYLTVPFVLSWSLVEAMATGCTLACIDTGPVREATGPTEAALVDFFDHRMLAGTIGDLLDDPDRRAKLSAAARERAVANYDLASLLPRQRALLGLPAGPAAQMAAPQGSLNFKSLSNGKASTQSI